MTVVIKLSNVIIKFMSNKLEFKDILKCLRQELGMDVKEFALKIGVTQSCISLWESGKRLPNYLQLQKIRKALDGYVSGDFLLGFNDF